MRIRKPSKKEGIDRIATILALLRDGNIEDTAMISAAVIAHMGMMSVALSKKDREKMLTIINTRIRSYWED